jgi:Glyoxalase-like domain
VTWIHGVVDVPASQHAATAEFWGQVLGWPAGAPWPTHPELRSFEPPSGTPYLHLQQIDGPPRVHLDVESGTLDVTVEHAVELGATLVGEQDHWRTLRSPGELPFCVLRARRHEAPQPITFPDGHRARLVQICIDSPRSAHAREVAFWRELLGGRWAASGATEFAGKWHDDAGSPLQLLFQQLDEDTGPVRAHLDQGTDDLDAEVRRLLSLGARDVAPGRGWHVLRDVAGLAFCATGNSPEQTRHRDLG